MAPKSTQLLLTGGALLLFVLLFIAPKINPAGPKAAGMASSKAAVSTTATLDVYVNTALKNLEPGQKNKAAAFIAKQKNDSVSLFWDKMKRPDLAAFYMEEQAKKERSAEAWFKAGTRYYNAVQFSKDQTEVPVLYSSAMRCFNKGLVLEPSNTDAKIMLASCYVEGSTDPMEGISRLKAIEKTDSNNVKLQLTFAFFSVKSGQLDKAISRFNKVLEIDSSYIEAYLHLADAYEQQNNSAKTIEALEKYADRTTEVTAKNEINKYIQQLKNK